MRSRLVEERLTKARTQGLEQLVILGAGLDSTAYRCTDQLDGLPVFEIDHPATQHWKKTRLTECNINLPDNLKFVGFDFENQTLAEALEAGGVRSNAVTIFTWLGVQMYLTPATVQATLAVLGKFPPGSQLIMDFAMPDATHPDEQLQDPVGELNRVVSDMGEPFESTYTEQELETCLKEAGFSDVSFYTAGRILDSFLDGNRDICSVPDEACFLLAATI
jgi:methyltransferase (TIGR00027 family)